MAASVLVVVRLLWVGENAPHEMKFRFCTTRSKVVFKSGVLSVFLEGAYMQLSVAEQKLHEAILKNAVMIDRGQNRMIRMLIEAERSRYYRKLGCRSLVEYIQKEAGIDSTYTFELARVAQKALEFPVLAEALKENRMRSGHAGRIISKITEQNAAELVEYACTHTFAQVGEYVAKRNPERATRETAKWISGTQIRVSIVLNAEEYELLGRARDLEAQRQKPARMRDAIASSLAEMVERRDPVKKAERAAKRKAASVHGTSLSVKSETGVGEIKSSPDLSEPRAPTKVTLQNVRTSERSPFTASQKHEVHLKARGCCSFVDHRGPCRERRHLQIHHIVPVKDGGSNDPSNLALVCWFHHDHIHQLCFPGMETPYWFDGRV